MLAPPYRPAVGGRGARNTPTPETFLHTDLRDNGIGYRRYSDVYFRPQDYIGGTHYDHNVSRLLVVAMTTVHSDR